MLEGSGRQTGTGQGRAHSRPLPGRASLCLPPSSKAAEECIFTEEKQARLRDSGQGPRAAPQRPLPSPLVHTQGQGKPIESSARLSNHRGLWARPDTVQKARWDSSTEAAGQAGGPTELTACRVSRSLLLDLCTRPSCFPGTSRPLGRAGEGGRPPEHRPAAHHSRWDRPSPPLLQRR